MPDTRTTIAQIAHAIFGGYFNEFVIDQKCDPVTGLPTWDDPLKLRFGAFDPGHPDYLGVIGFDRLVKDDTPDTPRRLEKGFIGFKLDPDPTIEIYLQERKDTTEDGTMRRVLRLTPTALELGVPITGATVPTGGTSSFLRSPNGRYELELQDDGNVVIYDEANGHIPTFDAFSVLRAMA